MILDELPEESQKGTQLGWITGFTWSRLQIIDYKSYNEVVHGSVPKDLIPIAFRKLKVSRTFKQHIWVDVFKFINIIILLLGLTGIIVGLATDNSTIFDVALSALLLGWLLKQFEECVGCCGSLRLKKKIRDLLQQLNRELQPVGIVLRFPIRTRKICFAFRWNLCKAIDYDTIQIWSCEEELQPLHRYDASDGSTNVSSDKESGRMENKNRLRGQKLAEDQSVYV